VDGKMDAEIAAVRPALATGRVELMTHTDVLRVVTDGAGRRVAGLLVRRDGEETVLRARSVAICAGLPGSALLLRRSATPRHRKGLGNAGGALGKYLGAHSTGMIFPMTGLGPAPAEHTKTFAINAYYEGSPGWPYPTGVIQAAGQMPFWREASRWMRPVAKLVGDRSITCFYMTEALPTPATGLVFDGDRIAVRMDPVENLKTFRRLRALAVEAFRAAGRPSLARKRAPYIWHEVGTARMGDDPASSVVDPTLQVHGVEGLYVADASVLPSAGAVNTGLTIAALSIRLGDHLAGDAPAEARAAAEMLA
jgi:choline dehydrogenase-like flavoprotein